MKRVVDKHTVAHLWANKIQDDARTPTGNLYFRDREIWSYGSHFLIAKHVENLVGEHAVLITKRNYSVTTSQHVTIVKYASRHIPQILVPDPDQSSDRLFDHWLAEIKELADKLNHARKPEKYVLQIQQVYQQAEQYASFFDLELPQYLIEAGQIQNFEQYNEVVRRESELRSLQEAQAQKLRLAKQAQDLRLWKAFKIRTVSLQDGYDYLRFHTVDHIVETSQRVFIPAEIARKFYAYILEALATGGCQNCDMRLMDRYQVSEINHDFIRVGCHQIKIKEIKAFIKKQGW